MWYENKIKSFELLKSLSIKHIDAECESKSENLQFWYERFSDLIMFPCDVIDVFNKGGSVD